MNRRQLFQRMAGSTAAIGLVSIAKPSEATSRAIEKPALAPSTVTFTAKGITSGSVSFRSNLFCDELEVTVFGHPSLRCGHVATVDLRDCPSGEFLEGPFIGEVVEMEVMLVDYGSKTTRIVLRRGDNPIVANVYLDGREIAQDTVPHLPKKMLPR